ncbi:hypothetical protein Pfo_012995 [Paulownia fortunei]|nr:hypothetical protein Pfo_012995 [Paulownia fortunei]
MLATNSMATRSSLELMLDKIQQLEDQPKDIPPALPVRPVSRARLPRARRPLQLGSRGRNSEENDASFKWGGFESKRTKKEDFMESFHQEGNAESDGIAASAASAIEPAQFDHFQKGRELLENSKEMAEKGISNIQKCYRGHQVRCYYKELRRGAITLQSFIRGEHSRRCYQYRSRSLRAIILIQKQTRKYFERRVLKGQQAAVIYLHSGIRGCRDRRHSNEIMYDSKSRKNKTGECRNLGLVADTKVPYTVLIDLQKRVLRTEAKVREKREENIALKIQIQEIEKKWQQYEERMKSKEKEWQDQLRNIQECLAAAKKNPAPENRFGQSDSTKRHYNQNPDTILVISGTPNGTSLDFPINSIYHQVDQGESAYGEDSNLTEVGLEQVCHKLHPQEELHKLKIRFKTWKKDYKNKLRDAQTMLKKLGNSETAKSQKNWWGRLSN